MKVVMLVYADVKQTPADGAPIVWLCDKIEREMENLLPNYLFPFEGKGDAGDAFVLEWGGVTVREIQ